MLEVLSNGFNKARDRFQGKIELTEDNIEDALKDIRLSLLEADVQYSVVKSFIARVKDKALGAVVDTRVKHGKQAQGCARRSFYQHLLRGTRRPHGAGRYRGAFRLTPGFRHHAAGPAGLR